MIESKVADPKCTAEVQTTVGRGAQEDGAPVSELLRAATLRSEQSLCEPEANWSFRGDTATARRAPPATEVYKRERQPRNIVLLYVKHEDAALQNKEVEARQIERRVEPPSPSCSCAALLMASLLGNSSRASGAQSGQVKCKLKRRRRRRSKRKGTTLQQFSFGFCLFFSSPCGWSCEPRLGIGARFIPVNLAPKPGTNTPAPWWFHNANLTESTPKKLRLSKQSA